MRYIFGFLDKWLSVFFLSILILFFWGLSKCSDDESVKIEEQKSELPLINPDGSINIKINESFQHPESGLIIGFDNGAGNLYNVSLPKSGTSMEVLFIGNSFDFEDKNDNKYKCTLLAYNTTLEVATIVIKREQAVEKKNEYEVKAKENEYIYYAVNSESFHDGKFETQLRIIDLYVNSDDNKILGQFYICSDGVDYGERDLYMYDKFKYDCGNYSYEVSVLKIFKQNYSAESDFFDIKIDGKVYQLPTDKDSAILKITKLKKEKKEDIYEEGQVLDGSSTSM
ncbi:hypothetical protein LV89_04510 [Arcicella aurantiaca]|uniref:Uncharacterized protein n=1 Tax=Arcicella aurantiaca TaxID=591202 RepID=A0A316DIK2_9BACT|nr:hypothetical protein [Arcicella aurantiaca]PWK17059.1 hypothetical protein LV89_04510 [Arcicella aurantiaca]